MNIQISNTNSTTDNTSYVRIYVDSIKVAEVSPSRRNPLGYLRQYQGSKYWRLMQDQIEFTGLFKLVEVNKIMSIARGVDDGS
jgi:hypothetical protein